MSYIHATRSARSAFRPHDDGRPPVDTEVRTVNVVQVKFKRPPDTHILEELRASGMRWNSGTKAWKGCVTDLPPRYLSCIDEGS